MAASWLTDQGSTIGKGNASAGNGNGNVKSKASQIDIGHCGFEPVLVPAKHQGGLNGYGAYLKQRADPEFLHRIVETRVRTIRVAPWIRFRLRFPYQRFFSLKSGEMPVGEPHLNMPSFDFASVPAVPVLEICA